MNTIYRVVFNRTRGVLMVANEITSSVQAKGSKTVVATAVAAALSCGTAFAQEYVDKTVEAENNATLQALVSKTGESLELTGDVFKNNTLNLKLEFPSKSCCYIQYSSLSTCLICLNCR